MKAVVLAAGEGRRLRPYTETMPKVMLPVANKPILEYVFDAVKYSGIDEVIVVVGYKKEVIMDYFKEYDSLKLTYVIQEKQLGTAHALLQAKKHIKDPFIVLAGDNIVDYKSIVQLIHEKSDYSLLIKKHPHPSKYGVVTIEKSVLKQIIEKPTTEETERFISTGVYKLPRSVFNEIEQAASQGIYALSTVIQSLVEKRKIITTITAERWQDIVYPWDLLQVNETMIQSTSKPTIGGTIEKGVTMKGAVSIGKDTTIYSGCYLVGPVVIGEGCEIGPNACIFPSTTIGNNSVIHPFCTIRNSVLMNDVHIGPHSTFSHTIIGQGSKLSDNFSASTGKTTLEVEGEFKKVDAIGAMIGEDCMIGSHVIIEPGTIIGRKCTVAPLKQLTKQIPSESKVM